MQVSFSRRIVAFVAVFVLAATVSAGEILSTMRNVSAVAEAHGFRLNIVHDAQIPQLSTDLSPAQAFEVLRPAGKSVTIGRLFTSCSCIQLESPKRTYGPDERVILTLRNVKPTPPAGQVYAVFVQITSPVRTTLRFDTYVQSGMAGGMPYNSTASGTGVQGASSLSTQTATGLASSSKASSASYQGSAHADAVAALTRQIDQGMSAAKQPAVTTISLPAPMAPPAQPGKESIEAVVEAKGAVESEVEARGMPSPLPPPDELTVEAAPVVSAVRDRLPASGAAVAGVEVTAVPAGGLTTYEDDADYGYDEDADLSPLPSPTVSQLQQAPQRVAQQIAGQGYTNAALTADEVALELRGDVDEDVSAERVVAGRGEDSPSVDDDTGTADLVEGYKNLDEYYEQSARAAEEIASKVTAETEKAGAVLRDEAPVPGAAYSVGNIGVVGEAPRYAVSEDVDEGDSAYWGGERDEGGEVSYQGGALPPATVSSVAPGAGTAYVPEQMYMTEEQPIRATLQPVVSPQVQVQPQVIQSQVQVVPVSSGVYEAGNPEPRPEQMSESRKPVQAVSLITIGARDMAKSIRFYEAIGWRRAARGKYDQTAFFQLQGQILALYPMNDLLREQNMPGASPAPGGMTLALHLQERSDVWSVYQRFIDAGGTSLRAPAEMASGAVTSYVADPDGNAWEISWVPQFKIDEDGGLWLP